MTLLGLIRHGATAWNEAGRIQGHADIPLSPRGRGDYDGLGPPPALDGAVWVSSPLRRAIETARLLGADGLRTEPRLIEMDWGAWEGRTLAELRDELGPAMRENENRGLDFRPPRGESPRHVQARLGPWLREVGQAKTPTVAVTHKGVIRALLALAVGWDMTGKPPARLEWNRVHIFALDPEGDPRPERLNQPLVRRGAPA
jgi:probable phosphoglycerate mutase